MKKILTKKGFTLIELIVVIAILAILAAILIPSLTNYIRQANISKNAASARSIYSQEMLNIATKVTPKATVKLTDGTDCVVVFDTATTTAANAKFVSKVTCGTVSATTDGGEFVASP